MAKRWVRASTAWERGVFVLGLVLGTWTYPSPVLACLLLFPDGHICDRTKKLDRLSRRPPKQAPTGSSPLIPSGRLP